MKRRKKSEVQVEAKYHRSNKKKLRKIKFQKKNELYSVLIKVKVDANSETSEHQLNYEFGEKKKKKYTLLGNP